MRTLCLCVGLGLTGFVSGVLSQEASPPIQRILKVGREGAGNTEAAQAYRELVKQGPGKLLEILQAMKGANRNAANWLRTAADQIAETALRAGQPMPKEALERFVLDTKQDPRGRRWAYEWLTRVDPATPGRLLPGFANDPSQELRRDAVAVLLNDASKLLDQKDPTAAKAAFQKALDVARDHDQVKGAAEKLKKLGVDIDLVRHFGFVTHWSLAAPFDNVKGVGFNNVYPPEKGVDLKATYVGKDKQAVAWKEHVTAEKLGVVDLNKAIGPLKGAVCFAYTVVESKTAQPVEIRTGSNNAIRVFLNGKEIYFREEYHHGMQMDQHVGKGVLQSGRNEILVKVCQNEQTDSSAQQWSFQLRICDDLGAAVAVAVAK